MSINSTPTAGIEPDRADRPKRWNTTEIAWILLAFGATLIAMSTGITLDLDPQTRNPVVSMAINFSAMAVLVVLLAVLIRLKATWTNIPKATSSSVLTLLGLILGATTFVPALIDRSFADAGTAGFAAICLIVAVITTKQGFDADDTISKLKAENAQLRADADHKDESITRLTNQAFRMARAAARTRADQNSR